MDARNLSYRCDRTWDELRGRGDRRWCDRCARHVVDLDAASPAARGAALVSAACVRFLAASLALVSPAHADEVVPGEGELPRWHEAVMGALDRSVISGPLLAAQPELAAAIADRLRKLPARGRLAIRFTIEQGAVTHAEIATRTFEDERLEAAVLAWIGGVTFPIGAKVEVTWPLELVPPARR